MARMPGAVWRPLPNSSTSRMGAYDILCLHTMVGSLMGTDSYFRTTSGGTNSHFGVGFDGTIFQWVDTAYRSGASYNGNWHLVSVETADTGTGFPAWTGSNIPAWTEEQLNALARIAAWCHEVHGIPLTRIPDALPGRRGVGYHRLGVPGYMVAGAEQWSTKYGKVCPGDRRIAQIPEVIYRAKKGAAPTPKPEPQEEPLMKVIQSTGRGIALVGPGYFRQLNAEEATAAVALWGAAKVGNDRQFDLWRAMVLQGTTADDPELDELAADHAAAANPGTNVYPSTTLYPGSDTSPGTTA